MKGIILAGGSGSRLQPATLAVNKQLLPVYDKPMIYYPMSVLMLAGIQDILIISSPAHIDGFKNLLRDGTALGLRISYAEQPKPEGVAQSLVIGREFIGDSSVMLVLGDNIFFGAGLASMVKSAAESGKGATIFAYSVEDPERYGVVRFDAQGTPVEVIEKPKVSTSPWAITGLYVYDNRAAEIASKLKPSARGELEITDVNKVYLEAGELQVKRLGRGYAWFDTGTHDALLEASGFIRVIQKRQGIQVACLEEIAFANGFIDAPRVKQRGESMANTDYGRYLLNLLAQS